MANSSNEGIPNRWIAYPQLHLVALAAASLALSLASGWTTWDGIKNFTNGPLLSFLITFGIQSVMVVAAWMIGEAIVAGRQSRRRAAEYHVAPLASIALLAGVALVVLHLAGARPESPTPVDASLWGPVALVCLAFVLGGIALMMRGRAHAGDGLRVSGMGPRIRRMLQQVPLWIMFLTCAGASIFFSFDSLFGTIYGSDDRARASHTRVEVEVRRALDRLMSELNTIHHRAMAGLLSNEDWQAQDKAVDTLLGSSRQAVSALGAQEMAKLTHTQEKISATRANMSAIETQKSMLDVQIAGAREHLEDEKKASGEGERRLAQQELRLAETQAALRSKLAEAKAEAIGVGKSGKSGRGRQFNELDREAKKLQIETDLLKGLIADDRKRLAEQIDKQEAAQQHLARLLGQANALKQGMTDATRSMDSLRSGGQSDKNLIENIAEQSKALAAARLAFVAEPTKDSLEELFSRCGTLSGTLDLVPGLQKPNVSCKSESLVSAARSVFSASASLTGVKQECGGPRKLEGLSTEDLLLYGHRCLQIAGLQGPAAAALRSELRQVALRRDDQAHRFIVTWNAFFDQNPLAFVSLFLAVAIDGLIFISGLLGARATVALTASYPRSEQIHEGETLLDAALLADPGGRARRLLGAIDPMRASTDNGYIGVVDLNKAEPSDAHSLREVLNIASVLGLARAEQNGDTYAIRAELIDRLSRKLSMTQGLRPGVIATMDPRLLLGHALNNEDGNVMPFLLEWARPVMLGPSGTHEIDINQAPTSQRPRLIRVLNAGVASGLVAADQEIDGCYRLSPAFFPIIAEVAASLRNRPDPIPLAHRPASEATAENARPRLRTEETVTAPRTLSPMPANQVADGGTNARPLSEGKSDHSPADLTETSILSHQATSWRQNGAGSSNPDLPPLRVNGGVFSCQCGGVKVGH